MEHHQKEELSRKNCLKMWYQKRGGLNHQYLNQKEFIEKKNSNQPPEFEEWPITVEIHF